MKKKVLLLLVTMFVLVLMSACGEKEVEQTNSEENDDKEVEVKKDEVEQTEVDAEQEEEDVEQVEEEDPIPEEYGELMELFETAISEEWELEKLYEYGIGYNMNDNGPLPNDYGYHFRDLNGDGKEEMILGYELKLEDGSIYKDTAEIYTIVDGEPLKVFSSGIRHVADIFSDGTIHEHSIRPGNGKQHFQYYHLKEDGTKEMIDEYMFEGATDTYKPSEDSDEQLSQAEVEAITEKYGEPEDFIFTPFLQVEANEGAENE